MPPKPADRRRLALRTAVGVPVQAPARRDWESPRRSSILIHPAIRAATSGTTRSQPRGQTAGFARDSRPTRATLSGLEGIRPPGRSVFDPTRQSRRIWIGTDRETVGTGYPSPSHPERCLPTARPGFVHVSIWASCHSLCGNGRTWGFDVTWKLVRWVSKTRPILLLTTVAAHGEGRFIRDVG